jgi:hypothetical protein
MVSLDHVDCYGVADSQPCHEGQAIFKACRDLFVICRIRFICYLQILRFGLFKVVKQLIYCFINNQ